MACFFSDIQRKPHQVGVEAFPRTIEKRLDPVEAFRLPPSIKQLIQPDPRNIDEVVWCKLTHAAATLAEGDYSTVHSRYPLSYYRAAALLWVTSARRPNEIMRLQVECLRRDWEPHCSMRMDSPFLIKKRSCSISIFPLIRREARTGFPSRNIPPRPLKRGNASGPPINRN